ncbi:MAG TPA: GNAT family N-acetyltransferase [Vicinamibacteria bacterium]|nr:GNAT family N-acetyltransferase [Vicinamibacteria bacterium]
MAERRRGGPRIREIVSPSDPAFVRAHTLLRRSFEPSELVSREAWKEVLREREEGLTTDTAWHLLVAEDKGRVVGAASGNYVGSLNVGLVGYVVIEPSVQARGLGSRLRRRLRLRFERDARRMRGRPLEAIVGEVRADNPWLRHLVTREGAIALDFPYFQPSLGGRHGRTVPLVLYYQPLARRRTWLGAAEVRRLLYGLWRRPYRVSRPLARPAFQRMLASLEGRRRIGQLDLLGRTAAPGSGRAPRAARAGRASRPPGARRKKVSVLG